MHTAIRSGLFLFCMSACLTSSAGDVMRFGRSEEAGRGFSFGIRGGVVTEFNAVVQETTRKLYDVVGEEWKQDRANNFAFEDFNVTGSHPAIGLGLQRSGRFLTFQLDANYMSISSEAVARRNYYLNDVGPLVYDGRSYDNMVILEGEAFSFDVNGATIEMRFQITPLTFHPVRGLRIVPFLDAGLFGFVGSYEMDAGDARDVMQYQNPVENFVVGGRVSGISGLGLPEYGGGLELRMGETNRVQFVLYGHYTVCRYSGGTSFLTSSSHREKSLEIDHTNVRVRAQVEFPLREGRYWFVGGQYQQIRSEGLVASSATDPEEIIALRERFDKEFVFRMTMLNAYVGMQF
ncbi:MAG: hypothetical protein ACNA71_02330 [Kiritimatiellia bacterium]